MYVNYAYIYIYIYIYTRMDMCIYIHTPHLYLAIIYIYHQSIDVGSVKYFDKETTGIQLISVHIDMQILPHD